MFNLSGSLDSVQSELNSRVIFQRNGRYRVSGNSIKSAHQKKRFTEQQKTNDEQQHQKTENKEQNKNQIDEKHKIIKNDLLISESNDLNKKLINSLVTPTKLLNKHYVNAEVLNCNNQTIKKITNSNEEVLN